MTTVEIRDVDVRDASCEPDGFSVTSATGEVSRSRKLMLATGVLDHVPDIDGIRPRTDEACSTARTATAGSCGASRSLTAKGTRAAACRSSSPMVARSVLPTDGPSELEDSQRERLHLHGIKVDERRVSRLVGTDGQLSGSFFSRVRRSSAARCSSRSDSPSTPS